jgi:hypothetical protein
MDYRISQRWLTSLITVIVLLAIADPAWTAEFSADTIIDRLGQKQQVKLYIKNRQIRAEMEDTFGQKQILISRPGKDQTFMLYPETKTYMRLPAVAVQSPVGQNEAALKKIGKRQLVGQENVEGYLCDKYEITYYNKYLGKMMVWVARKLEYPIQMIQVSGPPGNSVDRKLTNIKEHRVQDSLFNLPDGYRQVKKPQGDCRAGLCRINFF